MSERDRKHVAFPDLVLRVVRTGEGAAVSVPLVPDAARTDGRFAAPWQEGLRDLLFLPFSLIGHDAAVQLETPDGRVIGRLAIPEDLIVDCNERTRLAALEQARVALRLGWPVDLRALPEWPAPLPPPPPPPAAAPDATDARDPRPSWARYEILEQREREAALRELKLSRTEEELARATAELERLKRESAARREADAGSTPAEPVEQPIEQDGDGVVEDPAPAVSFTLER